MEKLSDEILVRIFSFLSARDLCRCSQVCNVAQFREKMLDVRMLFCQAGGKFTSLFTPNFFIRIVFNFSWVLIHSSQEKAKTMFVLNFVGVNKLYCGQCERAGECFLTCVFVTYFFRCVLHGVVWQTTFICILFCSCSIRLWPKGLIRGVRKCNIHTPAQTAAQTAQYTGTCNLSLFCQLSTPDVSIFLLMRLQ